MTDNHPWSNSSKNPMKAYLLATLATVIVLASAAYAEKAPLSIDTLRQADAIVVGTIKQLRIENEPSRFERGLGNVDWGIYLTLELETVEKGELADEQLEMRCFRIKTRRSVMEYLTPSGHHPIPGAGTRVRAYLNKGTSSWDVLLPNGITAVDDSAEKVPMSQLPDAAEVIALQSRAFTYLLPIEMWTLILLVGILLFLIYKVMRRWLSKRRNSRD